MEILFKMKARSTTYSEISAGSHSLFKSFLPNSKLKQSSLSRIVGFICSFMHQTLPLPKILVKILKSQTFFGFL